jgi:hypothetical protein
MLWALGPLQALKQGDAKVAWQKIETLVPTAAGRS